MFQNDVFGYCRNNVFGFNNPTLGGNTWGVNQTPWHFNQYVPYTTNTQIPVFYNQLPMHVIHAMSQTPWGWNAYTPQSSNFYNQGFLPFYGTNLPYQTTGYFGGTGINQHNAGQSQSQFGTVNPFFGQLASTPWGFNSICR
jgi:hypothetical protein